jgi:hypothetical protein
MKARGRAQEVPIETIRKLMDNGYFPEDAGAEAQRRRAAGDIQGAVIAFGIASEMRGLTRAEIIAEFRFKVLCGAAVLGILAFASGFATQCHIRDEILTHKETNDAQNGQNGD